MTYFGFQQSLRLAASMAAIALFVGFAPRARAAAVSDMLVCVSDQDSGGFGCGIADSYVVQDLGGTFSSSDTGSATGSYTALGTPVDGVQFTSTVGLFTSNGTGLYDSPGDAQEFNTVDVNSTGAGTLYLVFVTDNYSSGAPFSLNAVVDLGSGVASVTDTVCYNQPSGAFDYCASGDNPIIGSATATSSGLLGFSSSVLPGFSPFGIQSDIAITFSGAGTFSADFPVVAAPEPTSILLLAGAILLAFGAIRRKTRLV